MMPNLESIARRLRQQARRHDAAVAVSETYFPASQEIIISLQRECERAADDLEKYVAAMNRAAAQASGKPGL